jgi:hypothetical protein
MTKSIQSNRSFFNFKFDNECTQKEHTTTKNVDESLSLTSQTKYCTGPDKAGQ